MTSPTTLPDLRIRLLLVRHGESEFNQQGLFYGRLDPDLTARGAQQASDLAAELVGLPATALYTSPLVRARRTAEIINQQLNLPLLTRDALVEQAFGEWEGKSPLDIIGPDRRQWRRWLAQHAYHPPGGESLDAVAARARGWLAEVEAAHPGETVIAVAHAGFLQALLAEILGLRQNAFWPFRIHPAHLCDVALFPEGPLLLSMNGAPSRRWPPG